MRVERVVTVIEAGDVRLIPTQVDRPAAGQVAGHTLTSLVSPGTELALAYPVEVRYPPPVELGYAAVFVIEEVGPGVVGLNVGDVVMSMGKHASWQCLPADDVVLLPTGLDAELAPFSRIMNVAMSTLATSSARPGQTVGVVGLGLVGQLAARVFAAAGFRVVAVDPSSQRRSLAPTTCEVEAELPVGQLDLVVECSGREEHMLAGARALRPGGELVLTGVPWRRRSDTYLFDLADTVFHHFLTVRSGWEWQVPRHSTGRIAELDTYGLLAHSLIWLTSGAVTVSGLAETIPANQIVAGYDRLHHRTSPTLTYLLDWR